MICLLVSKITKNCASLLLKLFTAIENTFYYFKEQMGENYQKEVTKFLDETLPENFAKLDSIVKKNSGFLAAGKLSWADFYFAAKIEYLKWFTVWLGRKEKEDVIGKFPNLVALYEKVFNLDRIKKWIQERPEETLTF